MVTTIDSHALRWFAPPLLPTSSATRRARVLWSFSWSLWALLAVLLIAASAASPALLERRLVSISLLGTLVLCQHVVNRRGHTVLASWLLVLGLVAIVTQRAWDTGGVHAPVALFYMMIVFMAAGLVGIRESLVVAGACVASAILLVGAELAHLLVVPARLATAPGGSFVTAMTGIAVAVLCAALLFQQAEQGATEDLVNMFVHDMRSPLSVILIRLAMLQEDVRDAPELAEHADSAMTEAMRLNLMANNLLDVSRLERAKLPLHRALIDVSALALEVVRTLAPLDPSSRIRVLAGDPVVCACDAELLRRILENLLSNAIKHAPPDGSVRVAVAHANGCVRITVEDNGPGVAVSDRARIFERYSAASMRARSGHHSVGLGLAFCRLATMAHGGRVWVEDAEARGARFIVEIPCG